MWALTSTCRFWLTWEQTISVLKMKMEHWSASSANSPNRLRETTTRELSPPHSFHPSHRFHTFLSVPKGEGAEGEKQWKVLRTRALQLHLDCDASSWTAGVSFECLIAQLPQEGPVHALSHHIDVLWLFVREPARTPSHWVHPSFLPTIHVPLSTQHGLVLKASTLYLFFCEHISHHTLRKFPLTRSKCFGVFFFCHLSPGHVLGSTFLY